MTVREENGVFIIDSADFAFGIDPSNGLKARWWYNKQSKRRLDLGNGDEIRFSIGLPESKIVKPGLRVTKLPKRGRQLNEVVFELSAEEVDAKVVVTYRWNGIEPVMTKDVSIANTGKTSWDRLLDIHLGDYVTDATPYKDPDWPIVVSATPGSVKMVEYADPAGRERGYPAYLENQFFAGLAHPSGFSLLNGNVLELHHHPGVVVKPKEVYSTMQAVYGVAPRGEASAAFKRHVYSRMRRVLRGHDHPYAIISTCGAQDNVGEKFDEITEDWCLQHISQLAQAQKKDGLHFDIYDISFWHDIKGDLKQGDPVRFPDNFKKIRKELDGLGVNIGLWIDSGYSDQGAKHTMNHWTFGANPDIYHCSTTGDGKGRICRSTAPANQMYIDGFLHQIKENQVRHIKLDNAGGEDSISTPGSYHLMPMCNNPAHDHLPGILYSVEQNHNAQIALFTAIDKASPDVFLMPYWGHNSPWWLLHADTVYDVGLRMEMASLSVQPALFGRSGNVRKLDQGKYIAAKNYPDIAWDTLGIALSDWHWNNRLGVEKWQEGALMDMCRGSLLFQIWSDDGGIPEKDRPQMAEFINLLKASPDCFRRPIPIGNPFKDDWWGYCCTDGKRAMVAIDNGSWEDQFVTLELNSSWGLPDRGDWDIYGWYPQRVKFTPSKNISFGARAQIAVRPFTALLLEIVPRGQKPSLAHRHWEEAILPLTFAEKSGAIEVTSEIDASKSELAFVVQGIIPSVKEEGWLAVTTEFISDSQPFFSRNNTPVSIAGQLDGQDVVFEVALNNTLYPAPWQTYRLKVNKAFSGKEFRLSCQTRLKKEVELKMKGHYVPLES